MTIKIGWNANTLRRSDILPLKPEPLDLGIDSHFVTPWAEHTWVVRAPFDMHVSCTPTDKGLKLDWLDNSFELPPYEVFDITPRKFWRTPESPTIQWRLNNLFVADEPVWAETSAPFLHYPANRWPGVMIAGKVDIYRWTRPVQWVFEWHDYGKELHIERGEPIKYIRFHTRDINARFELVEIESTRELEQAMARCAKVVPFKKNALGFLDKALDRRPKKWIK